MGRGLIGHHHQGWIVHQGSGDGDALLLTTRHPARSVVGSIGQSHLGQQLVGPGCRLTARNPGQAQRRHHVVTRRKPADQVECLEDHPHCGAAATARPENDNQFPVIGIERESAQRPDDIVTRDEFRRSGRGLRVQPSVPRSHSVRKRHGRFDRDRPTKRHQAGQKADHDGRDRENDECV